MGNPKPGTPAWNKKIRANKLRRQRARQSEILNYAFVKSDIRAACAPLHEKIYELQRRSNTNMRNARSAIKARDAMMTTVALKSRALDTQTQSLQQNLNKHLAEKAGMKKAFAATKRKLEAELESTKKELSKAKKKLSWIGANFGCDVAR